jgi:hypothetical protein
MKALARRIELELRKQKHCAVYENELSRLWPLKETEREAKIARFATKHGFRLRFYSQGLCAIFDRDSPNGTKHASRPPRRKKLTQAKRRGKRRLVRRELSANNRGDLPYGLVLI